MSSLYDYEHGGSRFAPPLAPPPRLLTELGAMTRTGPPMSADATPGANAISSAAAVMAMAENFAESFVEKVVESVLVNMVLVFLWCVIRLVRSDKQIISGY